MKKVIPIIITCLFIFISCKKSIRYENAELFDISSFDKEVQLKGSEVLFDQPVMKPLRAYVVDSLLVLINMDTEFFIDKYNINTLKKAGECISFGSGPEDMVSPGKILKIDSSLWVLDNGTQKLLKYNKADFCSNEPLHFQASMGLKDSPDDVVFLKNDKLMSLSHTPGNKRFAFFNMNGDYLETKGEYPSLNGPEVTEVEKIIGYLCNMASNKEKDKIFITYKQTDLIEIYDNEGNLLKRKHGPDQFFPHVSEKQVGNLTTVKSEVGQSKEAYFFPVAYNDEVYVLYSGKVYDYQNPDYLYNKILVFDWDGNPKRIYTLDIPIFHFDIDPATKTIYGISDNPEFHIVKFQL